MGWTIGVPGFDSWLGLGILLFTTASRTALRPTQPPIQRVPGALSLRVKRPGREADHSPPSSAEVKHAWSYTSVPQYVFMACCLLSIRTTLPFTFYIPNCWGRWVVLCYSAIYVGGLKKSHKDKYEGVSKSFRTESITKWTTIINIRWEATQRVMVAKLTRLTHKIAIQLQPVTESCTICSSRSTRPVRKLLDTLSCSWRSANVHFRSHSLTVSTNWGSK
jgi:hypothetical protein